MRREESVAAVGRACSNARALGRPCTFSGSKKEEKLHVKNVDAPEFLKKLRSPAMLRFNHRLRFDESRVSFAWRRGNARAAGSENRSRFWRLGARASAGAHAHTDVSFLEIVIYHPSWNTDLGVYEINKITSVENSVQKTNRNESKCMFKKGSLSARAQATCTFRI